MKGVDRHTTSLHDEIFYCSKFIINRPIKGSGMMVGSSHIQIVMKRYQSAKYLVFSSQILDQGGNVFRGLIMAKCRQKQ
jgi:hypothetical protein